MKHIMKNKIPALLKERNIPISDLHAQILGMGERISYQSLRELANPKADSAPLPDNVRAVTLKMIAVALGVTLNDLVEIEAV